MNPLIQAIFENQLPFVTFTGITLTETGDGTACALLPERRELTNHIGSQHAAALFGVGETASGAAMASVVTPERLMSLRPVAANASIEYKKIAKGPIRALATATKTGAEVSEAIAAEGKVRFDVNVSLIDESDTEVATMQVQWYVSQKK